MKAYPPMAVHALMVGAFLLGFLAGLVTMGVMIQSYGLHR
jgi:hypothetical protein